MVSAVWLLTIRDLAPFIGIVILIGIAAFIIFAIIKWSQYWTKKALEDYAKEHPEVQPPGGEEEQSD